MKKGLYKKSEPTMWVLNVARNHLAIFLFFLFLWILIALLSPDAIAANANLFVSAENSQFDNYMSGPQVIEVIVIDGDISETDDQEREPDVTINGKNLRMVQAANGHWYGYFADRKMAQLADSTVGLSGKGLDFGTFCSENSAIMGIDLSDTEGFTLPRSTPLGGTNGVEPMQACTGSIDDGSLQNNVVRNSKPMNTHPDVLFGQIGVDPNAWPFIQLFELIPTGNVVVQYSKGGGVQTTTLTFDIVENYAGLELDRPVYSPGTQVHFTVTDVALNIDPTDADSWTFGTNQSLPMIVYQAFDKNGQLDADGTTGAVNLRDIIRLEDLMFEDNGQLLMDVNVQGSGIDVLTLSDNELQEIIPGDRVADAVSAGGTFGPGSQPVTIRELGPNSGVFSGSDNSDQSNIKVRTDVLRGKSATIDYNDNPISILTGFHTGSVDIQPIDDEWNSGENIPIVVNDHDLNKNSRVHEDLDLFNPEVESIPSLQIGNPFTLENLESAKLAGVALVIDEVQAFSQRAMLRVPTEDLPIANGSTLVLTLSDTFADLYECINDPSGSFSGFNFFNYDIRSLDKNIDLGPFTIAITDGVRSAELKDDDFQDLNNLDGVTGDTIFGMDVNSKVQLIFTFQVLGNPVITEGTGLPIVCDFFSFGFRNDGADPSDRISNMIVRLELEETGDNTATFKGALEYRMLHQLNVLNPATYQGLNPIGKDPVLILPRGMTDENAVRVNYFDLGADGLPTQVSDLEEAPSHSGIVSFDKGSYGPGETIFITLEDQDLNLNAYLIDIYTVVSPSQFPDDPARDTVGKPGLGIYSSNSGGAVGRLLEVTIDGIRWSSGLTENGGVCGEAGFPQDGLAASGFTLVETRADSGVFTGSFQIPETYCNAITGKIESTAGTDVKVNYVDFSDASSEFIEVGDSAGTQTSTGSVAFDRTIYPVPFGSVNDFFPEDSQSDSETPDEKSLFPVHRSGVLADGDQNIDAKTEEIGPGDLIIHIRVQDPDFKQFQSKSNGIAFGEHGPVIISVIRGSHELILATAGGEVANDGILTNGRSLIPGVTREIGPIPERDSDSGIFEFRLPIRYTDGPADDRCPETPDLGYSTLNGDPGILGRFDQVPINGDYCILQGDILQVNYQDPVDASGDPNTVTDSATFDLRNGVLQSDKSVYIMGRDMVLTLIDPDLDLDSKRKETYTLDLIEWQSDAATLTIGKLGGESGIFNPNSAMFLESGDNSGIFQATIKIPQKLQGNYLARGEEVRLQYMDWGPSGADFVGDESKNSNLTIRTSNLGSTIELDQKVYSWTDKVYITVVAPDWNRSSDRVEVIGHTDLNPIRIATQNFLLEKYKLAETGTNTGIFTGEVILTGFPHDADGDPNTGGESGFDTSPRTSPLTGGGPLNGFIETENEDVISASFEYSPGEQVIGSALIRWNLGQIQWFDSNYPADQIGRIRVLDPDMNLNPEAVDAFIVKVDSTTDSSVIRVQVRETGEATGNFYGEVQFTNTRDSRGATLRVSPGDFVRARYEDHTLPNPHQPSDHLELIATAGIGRPLTAPVPLETSNPRLEDAFGNPLEQVSVNQQVQISIDVKNSHPREQPFAYFVQIKNEQVLVESLSWVTGSLSPGQSFSPGLSWIPETPGLFEAALFFWESIEHPLPLTTPQTISIEVR